MADIFDEETIPFAVGIRLLPGQPHISTGYRLIRKGSHGVILESIVSGGRRYTSREAIRRFVVAVTAAANGTPASLRQGNTINEQIENSLNESGL